MAKSVEVVPLPEEKVAASVEAPPPCRFLRYFESRFPCLHGGNVSNFLAVARVYNRTID